MNKNELHTSVKYFLEGKLSEENELKLLRWIKSDKANRELFLQEQEFVNNEILRRHDKQLEQKWKVFKKKLGPQPAKTRTLFIKAASIAAAFIAGALLTAVIVTQYFPQSGTVAQIQNIVTPYGAKTNIQLPDSSIVWLNSGSALSFPSRFGKNRPVTLTGEAFFEVVKSEKPFVVSTSRGDVEVQGTSFNVKAFANENFQATLVSGSVKVKADNTGDEVTLRPGQQAVIRGNKINVEPVETDLFTSWKEGKLIFRDEHLPSVAKRLERWYNVKIELTNDKRLSEISYTGTLEMESFSEVLQLLKVTAPIDYTYNEKTRTIKIMYKQNK